MLTAVLRVFYAVQKRIVRIELLLRRVDVVLQGFDARPGIPDQHGSAGPTSEQQNAPGFPCRPVISF